MEVEKNVWTEVGTATARSDIHALRIYATTGADEPPRDTRLVAVPSRSWRPRTVSVEKIERTVIE